MTAERTWRIFLGSFILLIVSYFIYFIRYPTWQFFSNIEPIFALMFLSYFAVFLVAIILLLKDSKKSLSIVFKNNSSFMIMAGLFLALIYLGVFYLTSFGLGSSIELGSFPNLQGYENYSVYSIPSVLVLYLLFSLSGAFSEEVAYRGYIQTRISAKYGVVVGVVVSTLFFSLQHIHVFQINWISQFLQNQLIHVVLFGIFTGYLFYKSKENIWSVVAFHVLLNTFSVLVPIMISHSFWFTFYVAEIISFAVITLILHYLPPKNKSF